MTTGFGRDMWRGTRGIQTGRYVTGPRLVAQALYCRFTTPRGTLRGGADEEIYGLDVAGFIGRTGVDAAIVALPSQLQAEALKDDRVVDMDATVTRADGQPAPGLVTLTIEMTVRLSDDTVFSLTLAASEVSLELLGYQQLNPDLAL